VPDLPVDVREAQAVNADPYDAVAGSELRDLRRFADLSVDVWFEITDGGWPAPGDEWGHLCWQRAKASGRIPLDERDIEWDGT
jgi:hypothetical protein